MPLPPPVAVPLPLPVRPRPPVVPPVRPRLPLPLVPSPYVLLLLPPHAKTNSRLPIARGPRPDVALARNHGCVLLLPSLSNCAKALDYPKNSFFHTIGTTDGSSPISDMKISCGELEPHVGDFAVSRGPVLGQPKVWTTRAALSLPSVTATIPARAVPGDPPVRRRSGAGAFRAGRSHQRALPGPASASVRCRSATRLRSVRCKRPEHVVRDHLSNFPRPSRRDPTRRSLPRKPRLSQIRIALGRLYRARQSHGARDQHRVSLAVRCTTVRDAAGQRGGAGHTAPELTGKPPRERRTIQRAPPRGRVPPVPKKALQPHRRKTARRDDNGEEEEGEPGVIRNPIPLRYGRFPSSWAIATTGRWARGTGNTRAGAGDQRRRAGGRRAELGARFRSKLKGEPGSHARHRLRGRHRRPTPLLASFRGLRQAYDMAVCGLGRAGALHGSGRGYGVDTSGSSFLAMAGYES